MTYFSREQGHISMYKTEDHNDPEIQHPIFFFASITLFTLFFNLLLFVASLRKILRLLGILFDLKIAFVTHLLEGSSLEVFCGE